MHAFNSCSLHGRECSNRVSILKTRRPITVVRRATEYIINQFPDQCCVNLSFSLVTVCFTNSNLHHLWRMLHAVKQYKIADRTASQHGGSTFWGHFTSSVTWPFDSPYAISYWRSFGTKPLSVTVSEIFNVECNAMVDMTLIRPLNKGQSHSFWYQSISYTTFYRLSIVTFALGRTV